MKKLEKGSFGYLKSRRKTEIKKTVLYFALPLAIFVMGWLSSGTRQNLLTVVAVLGCLPACKSLVELVMYLRAGMCSRTCYEKVRAYEGGLLLYDLYLTSYRKNFQISALAVRCNTICGYTEDASCDLFAGEKHIQEQLRQSGYGGLTVKLFSNLDKFTDRLAQMAALSEKNGEKEAAVAQVIRDISL